MDFGDDDDSAAKSGGARAAAAKSTGSELMDRLMRDADARNASSSASVPRRSGDARGGGRSRGARGGSKRGRGRGKAKAKRRQKPAEGVPTEFHGFSEWLKADFPLDDEVWPRQAC